MKVDQIGWHILAILQENARTPLKEMAAEVGLSSPSVADRIQKMEESGVIRSYNAHLDLSKLGYSLGVYITIKIRFGQVERFEKFIPTVPEICECHKLTGRDCMLMKGYVKDPLHLEDLNTRLAVYGELTTSILLKSVVDRKVYENEF